MKTQIFNSILQCVAEATELPIEQILSLNKKQEIVEARAMIVYFGRRYGLSCEFLKEKLNKKSTYAVRYLENEYGSMLKCSFSLRMTTQSVEQKLAKILPNTNQ
jgi:hypothetical protein